MVDSRGALKLQLLPRNTRPCWPQVIQLRSGPSKAARHVRSEISKCEDTVERKSCRTASLWWPSRCRSAYLMGLTRQTSPVCDGAPICVGRTSSVCRAAAIGRATAGGSFGSGAAMFCRLWPGGSSAYGDGQLQRSPIVKFLFFWPCPLLWPLHFVATAFGCATRERLMVFRCEKAGDMPEAEEAVRKTVRDIRRSRGRPDRDGRSMEHRHLYFSASRPLEIALRKEPSTPAID